ncbi:MAG: GAK system XXXCH domain-containing protein [Desulfobaccales bacterium]
MEEKRHLGLQELADFLEDLARQLKGGQVRVGGSSLALPAELEGKVELWAADGRLGLKLKARWPQVPVHGKPSAEPPGPPPRPVSLPPKAPARSFKDIKKRLAQVFGLLKKMAVQGELPPLHLVTEFLALSRESARFAEPAWQASMQDFLDHAANLARAHAQGQLELFAHELRDLEARMRACHEEYA